MKKLINYSTEKNSIESTRNIPREELSNYSERIERAKQEASSNFKGSYKSSLDILVK